jgi:hypothetical protein
VLYDFVRDLAGDAEVDGVRRGDTAAALERLRAKLDLEGTFTSISSQVRAAQAVSAA